MVGGCDVRVVQGVVGGCDVRGVVGGCDVRGVQGRGAGPPARADPAAYPSLQY